MPYQGNLDIILDVVTNLERSFLEAKPFSAGRFVRRAYQGRDGDSKCEVWHRLLW